MSVITGAVVSGGGAWSTLVAVNSLVTPALESAYGVAVMVYNTPGRSSLFARIESVTNSESARRVPVYICTRYLVAPSASCQSIVTRVPSLCTDIPSAGISPRVWAYAGAVAAHSAAVTTTASRVIGTPAPAWRAPPAGEGPFSGEADSMQPRPSGIIGCVQIVYSCKIKH